YTGAYQFQDGTVHLSHRFYDTSTLGFTQPDPSRQELNNHTYAMCDPINNTDPTGLATGACLASGGLFAAAYASAAHTVVGLASAAGAWAVGGVAATAMLGPAALVTLGVIGVGGAIWGMTQNC
ncbi:RHS repeat-associated core domain-containing protein, partial [Nocardiopsis sp. MG754419]|uniref:RHS repeat-associated core domain-containing protein n=1 Tax=Nocardiopsis sp. MG754419 TaxID=2259865 RepID=UPI0024B200E3